MPIYKTPKVHPPGGCSQQTTSDNLDPWPNPRSFKGIWAPTHIKHKNQPKFEAFLCTFPSLLLNIGLASSSQFAKGFDVLHVMQRDYARGHSSLSMEVYFYSLGPTLAPLVPYHPLQPCCGLPCNCGYIVPSSSLKEWAVIHELSGGSARGHQGAPAHPKKSGVLMLS